MAQNQTDIQVTCVYALSGTYGMLPRFLYYATLVLAIFGRNKEWLVIGALVSSLAYAGTTAIHAMALCTSKEGVFDLDALGAWAVLSTAALAYVAMIHWSSTLRNSNARFIMVLWGILIGIGLIFNRAILYDTAITTFESPCFSANGTLLTAQYQLLNPTFNCTYKCFGIRKPMRGLDETLAVPWYVIHNKYSDLSYILVGPIMYAAYVAVSYDTRKHSPSQMCTHMVLHNLEPHRREEVVKLIYTSSNDSWYGGYFALFHYMKRMPWNWRKAVLCLVAYPWIVLGLIMDVLCLPFLVLNVILNELHLLRSGLPVNEAPYNVGQWSPWVNSALVVIAAIISKLVELKESRKQRKMATDEEEQQQRKESQSDLRRVDTDATLIEKLQLSTEEQSKPLHQKPLEAYLVRSGNSSDEGLRLV